MPADMHDDAVILQLVDACTSSTRASCSRISSSAIGLRHVLPVHTNSTITLASRRSVPSPTTPSRSISK